MAKGALNHCSNVLQLLKMVGSRKLSSAQSSGSLFCSGVPVSSTRRGARVMRVQHLRQLTVMVLHAMAFVHDHVLPANLCQETGARERGQRSQVTTRRRTRYLGQHMLVFDDVFVGGDQHVELAAAQLRDEGSSSSRRPLNTHTITCSSNQALGLLTTLKGHHEIDHSLP